MGQTGASTLLPLLLLLLLQGKRREREQMTLQQRPQWMESGEREISYPGRALHVIENKEPL